VPLDIDHGNGSGDGDGGEVGSNVGVDALNLER